MSLIKRQIAATRVVLKYFKWLNTNWNQKASSIRCLDVRSNRSVLFFFVFISIQYLIKRNGFRTSYWRNTKWIFRNIERWLYFWSSQETSIGRLVHDHLHLQQTTKNGCNRILAESQLSIIKTNIFRCAKWSASNKEI